MRVTIDIPGIVQYTLLGWTIPDDEMEVIGHSRIAYLSDKDPGHIFMPAALWHDAAYSAGASIQFGKDAWPRFRVDAHFLQMMLDIARADYELQKQACTLYLAVCKFATGMYEGPLARLSHSRKASKPSCLLHAPYVPFAS